MSEAGTDESLGIDEAQLRAILINNCQLSSEGIEQITTHMLASGRSFSESALQLGLVSSSDMEDARAWARRPASRGEPGVVEAAIHKVSGRSRRMLSRIGHQVQPGRDLVILHDPYGTHSEKLRALRTELMLLSDGRNQASWMARYSLASAFAKAIR